MSRILLILVLTWAPLTVAHGQASSAASDSARADTTDHAQPAAPAFLGQPVQLDEVVVTATRSARALEQVPMPISVVTERQIAAQGAVRLSELLVAQPGLQLNYDHGTGVQVQGFDADYTLILLNGEPILGRTAGTLDLDRVAVSGVQRVEIVRGPSSSLYGSEALAGVINVITKQEMTPLQASMQARYGTHGTMDLTTRVAGSHGPIGGSLFLSRYGSDGYDLSPATTTPTVPDFTDYTGRSTLTYQLGARTDLTVRARAAHESQSSTVQVQGEEQQFQDDASQVDWSLAPRLVHELRPGIRLEARLFASRYRTHTELAGREDGVVLSESRYDQGYGKAEAQLQAVLTEHHLLTVGAGYVTERVDADRVEGERTGGFAFVQDEWQTTSWLELVPSARLDAHSDYATRVSPKLSVLARPIEGLRLRASAGSGYKAPAFRQLYLSFTNPQVGYSVFGAQEVQADLQALEQQGQIEAYLRDPSTLGDPIAAERSMAFNVGAGFDLMPDMSVRVNAFHNEVRDLIDTQPVARKTNGQQVFTYFNRGAVFTRGVEAEWSWQVIQPLHATLSYTYLQAKDRDVLDELRAGRVYRRNASGRDVQVAPGDYAGLSGRSRHRVTAQLTYRSAPLGLTVDGRARYRSRYGFSDRNGNGIVDIDSEYAPSYAVVDLTLTKTLFEHHALQVGAENVADHVAPQYVPFLPGRTWFASVRFRF